MLLQRHQSGLAINGISICLLFFIVELLVGQIIDPFLVCYLPFLPATSLCGLGSLQVWLGRYSNRIEFIGQTWTNLTMEMAHCYEVSTKFTTHAFNEKRSYFHTFVYSV